MTIGAAQPVSDRGDVAGNIARHVRLTQLAAEHGAQALVFPELSLTGYELDIAERLAFSEDDNRLEPLQTAAFDGDMVLIVGAPIRLDSSLHIGAFIIYPKRPTEVYTKRYLGGDEGRFFQPGDRNPLVDLPNATAAVAICADTGRPSHPQNAAERGATVYLASVHFSASEHATVTPKLEGYAAKHGMVVALANSGAPSSTLDSAGGSSIWSESGELIARYEGLGSGVVLATKTESDWIGKSLLENG